MTYTTFKDIKTLLENPFIRKMYKCTIIFYSLYFMFSAQAFALQAEAPTAQTATTFEQSVDNRAQKIRDYYNRYDLPLADNAEDFVHYADLYDLDWSLVAAIGMIESTGGKFACQTADYSAFGWGSCKIDFESYTQSIQHITWNLAGENPKMAHYYAGKDIRGILETYNPPHIVPDYADKVMNQMEIIKSM